MKKWYEEDQSRGAIYYCIWLFFLWILSFNYSYDDYEIISWLFIGGGFLGCIFLSSYQHKKEYQKLKSFKEDIKEEVYKEMYNDLLEELKEELKNKKK
jgi:hypothetical protein